jgi:hypothetical protein
MTTKTTSNQKPILLRSQHDDRSGKWQVTTPIGRKHFSTYQQAVEYVETNLNLLADRHPSWGLYYYDFPARFYDLNEQKFKKSKIRRFWLENRKGVWQAGATIITPAGAPLPAYK